jgi:hypothetical protein
MDGQDERAKKLEVENKETLGLLSKIRTAAMLPMTLKGRRREDVRPM